MAWYEFVGVSVQLLGAGCLLLGFLAPTMGLASGWLGRLGVCSPGVGFWRRRMDGLRVGLGGWLSVGRWLVIGFVGFQLVCSGAVRLWLGLLAPTMGWASGWLGRLGVCSLGAYFVGLPGVQGGFGSGFCCVVWFLQGVDD